MTPLVLGASAVASVRRVIEEGTPAPDFQLESDKGTKVRLSDFRGRPVVLYFYPRDDTPGCTAQACGIRYVRGEFESRGAVVLGVSPDSAGKHVKFREKYSLPFKTSPTRTTRSPSSTASGSRRARWARSTRASSARRS